MLQSVTLVAGWCGDTGEIISDLIPCALLSITLVFLVAMSFCPAHRPTLLLQVQIIITSFCCPGIVGNEEQKQTFKSLLPPVSSSEQAHGSQFS